MGGRFWVTGTQLALLEVASKEERSKVIERIIDRQYIGNAECFNKIIVANRV